MVENVFRGVAVLGVDAVRAKGIVTYDGVVHTIRAILRSRSGDALAEEAEQQYNDVVAGEALRGR